MLNTELEPQDLSEFKLIVQWWNFPLIMEQLLVQVQLSLTILIIMIYWEPFIWGNVSIFYEEFFMIKNFITLYIGYFLCFLGILGLFFRINSIIYLLISMELIFLGFNVIFLLLGLLLNIFQCQLMVLIILTLSAAETVIGLSLLFLFHKTFDSTELELVEKLKF